MLSLTLATLIAAGSAQAGPAPAPLPARDQAALHPTPPSEYLPQWTRLALNGGTLIRITRWHDGRLLAGGRYEPYDQWSGTPPFLVESSTLGAEWTLVDPGFLPGTPEYAESWTPAMASDGTSLLFYPERMYRWRHDINGWATVSRPSGAGSRPMVALDVGRGHPASALMGLGRRAAGGTPLPPALAALDVVHNIITVVTPPQALDMQPLAVAISDLDGALWAAAFESDAGTPVLTVSADAGQNWDTLPPPPSGTVNALTWQGERLLAAVERAGVFAYHDDRWQRIDDGHPQLLRARLLEVSVHDADIVFAAGPEGLSRTVDGGLHWSHHLEGTGGRVVESIFTDPADPALVFAGVRGEGVLASDDAGLSFLPASHGIGAATVLDVTSNPANPRHLAVLQARADGVRVRESYDGGASWGSALVAPARPENLVFGHDGSLWMLAQRSADGLDSRLYRRAGGRWLRATLPVPAPGKVRLEFVQRGEAHGTLYAGGGGTSGAIDGTALAWRSLDDGRTWGQMWQESTPLSPRYIARALLEVPGFGGRELLIDMWRRDTWSQNDPRVRRSSDGGASWMPLIVGGFLQPAFDRWLCGDPQTPGRLISVIGYVQGFLDEMYLDSGAGWLAIEGRVPKAPEVFDCWFHEGQLHYLAGMGRFPGLYYGREGSAGQPAPATGDWPAGQTLAVHRWEGGLLAATRGGLWHSPPEDVLPAPVLLSATDIGSRMGARPHLVWTGGAEWVRILRDGEEVAWVRNTGEWSARLLGVHDGASAYRVCNGFDDACSDDLVPTGRQGAR